MMLNQDVSPQRQRMVAEPLLCDLSERLPHVRQKRKSRKGGSFLSPVPGQKNYTLVFEDDRLPDGHGATNVVKVNSLAEVMIYYGLLGSTCEMYLSPEYGCTHFELLRELENLPISLANEALAEAEAETVSAIFRKLPLDVAGLLKSRLAVRDEDVLPGIINPEFIHKKNPANGLLSEQHTDGRLVYYNMLMHSEELQFDHGSDHLQGMLLLEAMRQAGIATAHISSGLPTDGGMTLMSYCTNFYNYVEDSAPIVIRSYSSYNIPEDVREKESYAICQVYQWGKLCAEALLDAVVFMNKERYKRHRSITKKISERNKRQFLSKIKAAV